jgi:hypothetical protein
MVTHSKTLDSTRKNSVRLVDVIAIIIFGLSKPLQPDPLPETSGMAEHEPPKI